MKKSFAALTPGVGATGVAGALVAEAPVANLLSDIQDEAGASFAVDRWLKEM